MNVKKLPFILLICALSVSFTQDDPLENESAYEAVIMYRTDLKKSVKLLSTELSLNNTGKLYYKDQFIFVTRVYEGIHIIDNHDPSNPENVCFIEIPGCQDLAIKQTILYADNATDLVAIDISDIPNSIDVVERVARAFPNPLPPDLDYIPNKFRTYNRPENTVIVGWKKSN